MENKTIVYVSGEYRVVACGYLVTYVTHDSMNGQEPNLEKEYFKSQIKAIRRINELKRQCVYKLKNFGCGFNQ